MIRVIHALLPRFEGLHFCPFLTSTPFGKRSGSFFLLFLLFSFFFLDSDGSGPRFLGRINLDAMLFGIEKYGRACEEKKKENCDERREERMIIRKEEEDYEG